MNVCGAVCFLLQVWDGVSNRCISVFPKAHAGAEVCMIGYIYVCVCVRSFGVVCCGLHAKLRNHCRSTDQQLM